MSDDLKWTLLQLICESPGWAPPDSRAEQIADELRTEGWVLDRLDGFEATPVALESYPHFNQPDRQHLAPPSPKSPVSEPIPFENVVGLLYRLLNDRPISLLADLCHGARVPGSASGLEVDIARQLAERLR